MCISEQMPGLVSCDICNIVGKDLKIVGGSIEIIAENESFIVNILVANVDLLGKTQE